VPGSLSKARMKLTQPPTKSRYTKIPSKGQTPTFGLKLRGTLGTEPCADMTANFLAFDYRRLSHLVLAKPPRRSVPFQDKFAPTDQRRRSLVKISTVTGPAHPPSVSYLFSRVTHTGPSRGRKRKFRPQVRRLTLRVECRTHCFLLHIQLK